MNIFMTNSGGRVRITYSVFENNSIYEAIIGCNEYGNILILRYN